MKLRVLFLKKIHILYLILTILILSFSTILLLRKDDESVFVSVGEKTLIKADLTGDGKEDILYINTENDKYYLQVNSNNKSFYLNPDRKINSMGYYYPFYPMKVNLLDINRDKVPEIFLQSSEKGSSIQHIFTWDGSEFKNIFCSYNNIMGVIDSKNNRTPKFISGTLVASNNMKLSHYMLLNWNIEKVQNTDDIKGKAEIIAIIQYITSLPGGEAYKPADVFYPGFSGKDLSLIGKMAAEKRFYKFTDAFFTDSKFNKDGEPIEYKWILNFKSTLPGSGKDSINKSVIVKLKRTSEEGQPFKVSSISENAN
ncbi:FG-GAP repeat domain-containing protein [Clostridium thermarum]|uniref:FG-GAP repeat domain-containing protein n=1 Tax=Clostridium thermarum TaxID=1716543 RepID=UPI0013D71FF9|nr:VCBS repeat-containing protein [Clostridium thermarum]